MSEYWDQDRGPQTRVSAELVMNQSQGYTGHGEQDLDPLQVRPWFIGGKE
jgi:hypothetical protein